MIKPLFCMKAKLTKPTDAIPDGYICQEKIDGIHIQILIHGDAPTQIFSCNKVKETGEFNDYTLKLNHLIEEIDDINRRLGGELDGQILEGEAIAYNQGDRDFNRRYVGGTLNALVDECISRQHEKEMIQAVLYNMPYKGTKYSETIAYMHDKIGEGTYLKVNPYKYVSNGEHVLEFNTFVEQGAEGIILYNPDEFYKVSYSSPPRTKAILKIKEVQEREVLLIDIIEGKNQFTGTFGAFLCEDYRGKRFTVGRGKYKNTDLDMLWSLKDQLPLIGNITYHMETPDSYNLPILQLVRFDKSVDDWNKEE